MRHGFILARGCSRWRFVSHTLSRDRRSFCAFWKSILQKPPCSATEPQARLGGAGAASAPKGELPGPEWALGHRLPPRKELGVKPRIRNLWVRVWQGGSVIKVRAITHAPAITKPRATAKGSRWKEPGPLCRRWLPTPLSRCRGLPPAAGLGVRPLALHNSHSCYPKTARMRGRLVPHAPACVRSPPRLSSSP